MKRIILIGAESSTDPFILEIQEAIQQKRISGQMFLPARKTYFVKCVNESMIIKVKNFSTLKQIDLSDVDYLLYAHHDNNFNAEILSEMNSLNISNEIYDFDSEKLSPLSFLFEKIFSIKLNHPSMWPSDMSEKLALFGFSYAQNNREANSYKDRQHHNFEPQSTRLSSR